MKSGFAVIIGRSNVGKSTLINSLVKTKVAITTPKPQTTRRPIQGVLTLPNEGQIVFVDTPGLMQKAKDPLTQRLSKYIADSLRDIDVVLYVVDATRTIGNEEKEMLKIAKSIDQPVLLVINKTDSYESRDCIDFYRDLASDFSGVVEISAKTGSNQDKVIKWILENLPEGDYMYPDFQVSNMTNEEQIGEIIREKLFLRLREEVPYTTEVEVHKVEEQKNGVLRIEAAILTTEERYKRMIIGKGGQGIKEIGQSSRKELESMTSKKVYLDLNVKADPHWVSRMD